MCDNCSSCALVQGVTNIIKVVVKYETMVSRTCHLQELFWINSNSRRSGSSGPSVYADMDRAAAAMAIVYDPCSSLKESSSWLEWHSSRV